MRGSEREIGRERICSRLHAVSPKSDVGLKSQTTRFGLSTYGLTQAFQAGVYYLKMSYFDKEGKRIRVG